MDPRKWMVGGPIPEPGDFDEEIEAGRVVVEEYLEPNPDARVRVVTEAEAERIRLKPEADAQA